MTSFYRVTPASGHEGVVFDKFEDALQALSETVSIDGLSPASILSDGNRLVCTYWNERAGLVLYVNHDATPEERITSVANFKNVSVSIITNETNEMKSNPKMFAVDNPNSDFPLLIPAKDEREAARKLIVDQNLEADEGDVVMLSEVSVDFLSDTVTVQLDEED